MGQDVELEITPPGGGTGHFDILTGIIWDPTAAGGMGAGPMSLVDPLVEIDVNDNEQTDPFTVNISANGNYLSIPTAGGKDGEGNEVNGFTGGNITGYVEESVTPEPASIWLVMAGIPLALSQMRHRK